MTCPIFEALKRGERFPVSMLLNEHESLRLFWDWWWENAQDGQLSRPYTVADGDPWLAETTGKESVDTESTREYLSEFALFAQRTGALRRGPKVPRSDYRGDLVNLWASKGIQLDKPWVVMTGGGYGAGKTTITDFLVRHGKLPISLGAQTGVDYFKAYLPEFSLLQRLCDGRASTVVQNEARLLADHTFERLVANRLSFAWDSSMSNKAETIKRLESAKTAGYQLMMVSVFAPLQVAIRQAMKRAKATRRFAHPEKLPESHQDFQRHFPAYLSYCDKVYAFVNEGIKDARGHNNAYLVAEKVAPNAELAINDRERFSKFSSP